MAKRKSKKSEGQVEARPIGEGLDPLAAGERLHNPSNSEAETHYEADDSELKAEEKAAADRASGQDANALAEEHNAQAAEAASVSTVPNADAAEQDEVAEGREEPGEEVDLDEAGEPDPAAPDEPELGAVEEADNPPVDDEPEEVEVPERTEEEEIADAADREDALEEDRKEFS